MSFVMSQPEALIDAAAILGNLNAALSANNAAAASATTGWLAPAADDVSAQTAARLVGHGRSYHVISAQAAAIREHLVTTLTSNADSYASTEAANAVRVCLGAL